MGRLLRLYSTHSTAVNRCRVLSSFVHGSNPSRFAAHFYTDFDGVSGPPLTSRCRYFRSGCGFHLRRAIDGRALEAVAAAAASVPGPTAMRRRRDRSSTRSGPDGERPATDRAPSRTTPRNCYVLVTGYDPWSITLLHQVLLCP